MSPKNRMHRRLNAAVSGVSRLLTALVAVLLAFIMIGICVDVLSRNLGGRPISGLSELNAMAVILVVFLALPTAIEGGRMARTELFLGWLRARSTEASRIFEALFMTTGAVICGLISLAIWTPLSRAITRGQFVGVEGVFTFPLWPMHAAVLLGAVLASLRYLLDAVSALKGELDRADEGAL